MEKAMFAMNDAFDGKIETFRPHDRFEECTEFDVLTGNGKNKSTFIVFCSEDAIEKAIADDIRGSVELFYPEFIQEHLKYKLPIEAIVAIQGAKDANKIIFDMLIDFDSFVADALFEQSYGYFLGLFDGQEDLHKFDGKYFYFYLIKKVKVVKSV